MGVQFGRFGYLSKETKQWESYRFCSISIFRHYEGLSTFHCYDLSLKMKYSNGTVDAFEIGNFSKKEHHWCSYCM
jgi:hypothetical protein